MNETRNQFTFENLGEMDTHNLESILDGLSEEELARLEKESIDFIETFGSMSLETGEVDQETREREFSSVRLTVPVAYQVEVPNEGALDKHTIEFIKQYNLDMPSSLAMRARRVFNAEPSIAGFAFENFMAANIALHCMNATTKTADKEFLLYDYIMDKRLRQNIAGPDDAAITNIMNKYLPGNSGTKLGLYPGPVDLPTKQIFLDYCTNRIPGVGKPAGGSQTVGPDLCMWLKDDVFLVLGSKISKKAFAYTHAINELTQKHGKSIYELWATEGSIPKSNPAYTMKSANELLVSRKELLDNVGSIAIEKYGSKHADKEFGDAVRSSFFEHKSPLKLYIEVNCVLPFRPTSISSGNVEYDSAIDMYMRLREVIIPVGNKNYRLNILRINVHNANIAATGLLSDDDESLNLLKKLFIEPMWTIETIEKNTKIKK